MGCTVVDVEALGRNADEGEELVAEDAEVAEGEGEGRGEGKGEGEGEGEGDCVLFDVRRSRR
jgi:hypothetical protein